MWCTIMQYEPCCGRKQCGLSALPSLQCQLDAKLVALRFCRMARPPAGEGTHTEQALQETGLFISLLGHTLGFHSVQGSCAAGSIRTGLATMGDKSPVTQLRGLEGGSCHNITCAVSFSHIPSHTRPSPDHLLLAAAALWTAHQAAGR